MDRYGLVNVVNAGAGKQRDVKERPRSHGSRKDMKSVYVYKTITNTYSKCERKTRTLL